MIHFALLSIETAIKTKRYLDTVLFGILEMGQEGRRDSQYCAATDRGMRQPLMNMIPAFGEVGSGQSFTRRADRPTSTTRSDLKIPMRLSHPANSRRSDVIDGDLLCQKNTSTGDAYGGIAGCSYYRKEIERTII